MTVTMTPSPVKTRTTLVTDLPTMKKTASSTTTKATLTMTWNRVRTMTKATMSIPMSSMTKSMMVRKAATTWPVTAETT